MFSESTYKLFHAVTSQSVKCGDVDTGAAGQDEVELETATSCGREDAKSFMNKTFEFPVVSSSSPPHVLLVT